MNARNNGVLALGIAAFLWLSGSIGGTVSAEERPMPTQPAPPPVADKPSVKPVAGPSQPGSTKQSGGLMQAAEPTPLEDVLLEKGLITMDDWIRIKAQEEQKAVFYVLDDSAIQFTTRFDFAPIIPSRRALVFPGGTV